MRLHIDWTLCDGRGLCIELLPEIVTGDEWGYPIPYDGSGNDMAVPNDLREHAQRAIKQCPRSALRWSS